MNKQSFSTHFLILVGVMVLSISASYVLADGWAPGLPSHSTLYVDTLTSKTDASAVIINDATGLTIEGGNSSAATLTINNTGPAVNAMEILFQSEGFNTSLVRGWSDDSISGHLQFFTHNGTSLTEKMRIDEGGDVGIGTVNPSEKLVVAGGNILIDGDHNELIIDDAGSSGQSDIQFTNDGTLRFVIAALTGADKLHIKPDDTDGITIDSVGNVGIGMTSPAAKLSFNNLNDGSNGPDGITWYNPTPTLYGIHRTAGTWVAPNYQQLNLAWNTGIILNPGTAYGKSYVEVVGNGVRVTSGKVGIGTVSPAAKLTVTENFESTALTNFTQAISSAGLLVETEYTANAYTPGLFWSTSNNNPTKPKAGIWLYENGSGTDMMFGTSDDYATGINNTALTIDQAGNVGIGTANPTEKLEIYGNAEGIKIRAASTNLANSGNIRFLETATAGIRLQYDGIGAGLGTLLIRDNDTSSEIAAFTREGNVGIGTVNPLRTLHVLSSDGRAPLLLESRTDYDTFSVLPWDGRTFISSGIYYTPGGWVHDSADTNNALFTIDPGTGATWYSSNNSTGSWNVALNNILWNNSGAWAGLLASVQPGDSYITGGNFGIGTANPGVDRLDVRGGAYASKGWQTTNADYAEWFEKEENAQPGDIIGINLETGLARPYRSDDKFIGIISTHPAVIGNRSEETNEEMGEKHILVGLVGQVNINRNQVNIQDRIVYTLDGVEIGILLANGKVLIGI